LRIVEAGTEREQSAVAVLHDELARPPRRVTEAPRELHAGAAYSAWSASASSTCR
jgi:hypothetical protein